MYQYNPKKEVSNRYIIFTQIVVVLFFSIVLLIGYQIFEYRKNNTEEIAPTESQIEQIVENTPFYSSLTYTF